MNLAGVQNCWHQSGTLHRSAPDGRRVASVCRKQALNNSKVMETIFYICACSVPNSLALFPFLPTCDVCGSCAKQEKARSFFERACLEMWDYLCTWNSYHTGKAEHQHLHMVHLGACERWPILFQKALGLFFPQQWLKGPRCTTDLRNPCIYPNIHAYMHNPVLCATFFFKLIAYL